MLFNSPEFLLFLPIVFGLYWFVVQRNLKAQNVLLLVASYVFYGWWDWRFLGLIAFSTVVDFFVGIRVDEASEKRIKKRWMAVSLLVNLGLLAYFKYANFFIESWVDAWATMGVTMHASSLQVILPVGISFYTFQTLSYSIDIYRGTLKPTRSLVNFAAFVSFFPQLVAGPIERASRLLPQIENKREFTYEEGVAGLRLILWGMFKKVVVADTCAPYVDMCFNSPESYSGAMLVFGAILFSFQIYGDFSGYSDIAIGTAKLFGIRLMTNFKTPYFSRDIAEFWRRWHISLSTWFRDYLYIPLGGSRVTKPKAVRNVLVIFIVSGFWHGANWTFIVWGAIHALLFIPLLINGTNRTHIANDLTNQTPTYYEALKVGRTFILVTVAWVFFRADNLDAALNYLTQPLANPLEGGIRRNWPAVFAISFLVMVEYIANAQPEQRWLKTSWARALAYLIMASLIGIRFSESPDSFIYFQF